MSVLPTRKLIVALLLCAAAAACGRAQSGRPEGAAAAQPRVEAAAAAGDLDACAFLAQTEAEAALGEAAQPPANQVISPASKDRAGISQCRYQSAASPAKTITVFVRRSPVADHDPDGVRQTLVDSGIPSEEVTGLGEHAFWAAGQLHVFAPDRLYLIITISGFGAGAEARQAAVGLARHALERA